MDFDGNLDPDAGLSFWQTSDQDIPAQMIAAQESHACQGEGSKAMDYGENVDHGDEVF